jgi:hypothetical protein
MSKSILEKGTKFGRLTVIIFDHEEHHIYKDNPHRNYREYFYKCVCDCGKEIIVSERSLKSGNTKSCGCLNHDKIIERNTKHNLSRTRLYKEYHGMKKRCYNKNARSYKDYGKKGIVMCKQWLDDFVQFYEWALANGYSDGLTIERIDIRQNYCPENCKWIPIGEQAKNTSRNKYYEINGIKHLIGDWCKIYDIPFTCVRHRLERGWDLQKALSTPNGRKKDDLLSENIRCKYSDC